MSTQKNIENQDHDNVWELLPWYVNQGLSLQEVNQVETHIEVCMICQSELARCQELNQSVKTNQQDEWMPSPPHFAKVLEQVDALEARRLKSQDTPGWLAKWLPWLNNTPGPARFTLALQGALVVALATTLLIRGLVPGETYQTLSQPNEHSIGQGQQVRLVFRDDLTEKELRGLLIGVQGRLVAGPTPLGVYTIVLEQTNVNAPTVQQTLNTLRSHPKVRLAEMASAVVE